jgi:hypothetical protein
VIAGTVAARLRFFFEPKREAYRMPLLFYFPLIVWMGMMEFAQQEMHVPVKVKAQSHRR